MLEKNMDDREDPEFDDEMESSDDENLLLEDEYDEFEDDLQVRRIKGVDHSVIKPKDNIKKKKYKQDIQKRQQRKHRDDFEY